MELLKSLVAEGDPVPVPGAVPEEKGVVQRIVAAAGGRCDELGRAARSRTGCPAGQETVVVGGDLARSASPPPLGRPSRSIALPTRAATARAATGTFAFSRHLNVPLLGKQCDRDGECGLSIPVHAVREEIGTVLADAESAGCSRRRVPERKRHEARSLPFYFFLYGGQQRDFLKICEICRSRGHPSMCSSWMSRGNSLLVTRSWIFAPADFNHRRCLDFSRQVERDLAGRHFDAVIGFSKMSGLDVYYAADTCYREKALSGRPFIYRLSNRFRLCRHGACGLRSGGKEPKSC